MPGKTPAAACKVLVDGKLNDAYRPQVWWPSPGRGQRRINAGVIIHAVASIRRHIKMKYFRIQEYRRSLQLSLAVAGALFLSMSVLPAVAGGMDATTRLLAKLDAEWSNAATARDADRVTSFYAEDGIAYPPDAPAAVGHAAIKKVWEGYFAEKTLRISWKADRVEVAKSGDIGTTGGASVISLVGPDGKPVKLTGKYVVVWKKQKDGSWKAIYDIWNGDSK